LKFYPVFLRDLSWDLFGVFINDICDVVAHCFLLMITKFTEPLDLLRTAIYFSLTLTLYRVGALLTV
jgi:hypothetical protein